MEVEGGAAQLIEIAWQTYVLIDDDDGGKPCNRAACSKKTEDPVLHFVTRRAMGPGLPSRLAERNVRFC